MLMPTVEIDMTGLDFFSRIIAEAETKDVLLAVGFDPDKPITQTVMGDKYRFTQKLHFGQGKQMRRQKILSAYRKVL
jgi:hypothetical protein